MLNALNYSSGLEAGGRLLVWCSGPRLFCWPLTGKKIGDVIHINDVILPEGTKPTIDRNFVIANVAAPAGYVETAE